MKKLYFNIDQNKIFINRFSEILNSFSGKSLIISFIQENRDLEKVLDVSDMIIYDNSDYISNIIDFEKSLLELDNENLLLPSSYKIKETNFDFQKLISDIDLLNDEEIENIFILFDNKVEIQNKPETIKIVDENSEESKNVIIIGNPTNLEKFNDIVGFVNEDNDDFIQMIENLKNNTFIKKKNKKTLLEKIKGIFSKNG